MLERDIEQYLTTRVHALGGEVRKVKWIGRRHAPDRLLLLPDRRAFWVECKAPGAKPRPGQVREHERMRRFGERVEVVDSLERVNEVLS